MHYCCQTFREGELFLTDGSIKTQVFISIISLATLFRTSVMKLGMIFSQLCSRVGHPPTFSVYMRWKVFSDDVCVNAYWGE